MNITDKFKEIVQWQKENSNTTIADFSKPILEEQITAIEKLIEEPLPKEFKVLYSFSNGYTTPHSSYNKIDKN